MYVITGGTGFLGLVLIKQMLESNLKPIKVLVRDKSRKELFEGLDVIVKVGSLLDESFLNNEINEETTLIHLAALVSIGKIDYDLMYETNVTQTKLIADIALKKNVKKFIYISSTSAVFKEDKEIIEPNSFNHHKSIGYYAKTKSITSQYIYNLIFNDNLNGIIIYPSLIVGPFDYRISSISRVLINFLNKNNQAYIKGSYNFIDVRDLANIIISTITLDVNKTTYLATNKQLSIYEMFKHFDKYKVKKTRLIYFPLFLIKIVMPLIMIYYKLFKKDPIFTNESIRIINSNNNFSNEKVKNELNINFRSIDDTFNDMVDFIRKEGLINE